MTSLEDQLKDRHLVASKNDSMQENIASLQIENENKRKELENLNKKNSTIKEENEQLNLKIEDYKFKLFEHNRKVIDSNLNLNDHDNIDIKPAHDHESNQFEKSPIISRSVSNNFKSKQEISAMTNKTYEIPNNFDLAFEQATKLGS